MIEIHGHAEPYKPRCFLCELDEYAILEDIGINPNNGNFVEHYATDDAGFVRVTAADGRPVTFIEYPNSLRSVTRFVIEVGMHPAGGGQ